MTKQTKVHNVAVKRHGIFGSYSVVQKDQEESLLMDV